MCSGITTSIGADASALDRDSVRCWGYNGYGELGSGSTTDSNVPVTTVSGF
jgi:hypothetical protein